MKMDREPQGSERELFTSQPANEYNEGAYFLDATVLEGLYRAGLHQFSRLPGLPTLIP